MNLLPKEKATLDAAHPADPDDPHFAYTGRLKARKASAARYEQVHIRLGNVRLLVFIAAVAMGWAAYGQGSLSAWWLLVPAGVFVGLMVIHERVLRASRFAERACRLYEQALERLADRWAGAGNPGDRFLHAGHPYAADLDLFGSGGLFDLLCMARTRSGEETLANWLLVPASPEQIAARQAAVEELRHRVDLREDLALLGEEVGPGIHTEALIHWGQAPPVLDTKRPRIVAFLLSLAMAAVLGAGFVALFSPWEALWLRIPFAFLAIAAALFGLFHRARVARIVEAVELPAHDLDLFAQVLVRLEREQFESPLLKRLRAELDVEGRSASHRIARLDRLIAFLDSREHVLMRVIGPLLLWTTQVAFAIEAWRRESGSKVGQWLSAVGEVEALCSLANYAYEHPADPFAELVGGPPRFEGEGIGHPMIPESRCVRNDVHLNREPQVFIVSGSNMSGKSTLLRTVGINTVLAMAGAPVRARGLLLTPLSIGASIRVLDSLQEGTSRFYAEIKRLRQIVDLAGQSQLLFLLDELLHGTNSHDRRIGAEGLVRGLVDRGAIGLLTTHDLALARIVEAMAPRVANVHFEDQLEGDKLQFDYRLRAGVVTKSNALELMRSIGLEV